MGSRGGGGGGSNGGGIPPASRKMIQSLKEIVNGVTEAEIYSTLKDCNMDPNEAVNRLLSQDSFHEVKSKREKKKEFKDTTESRSRGGSTSNRGAKSGTDRDRYAARGGSTNFSSSESGGLHGKPTYKRENGASSVAPHNGNWHPTSYSDSLGLETEPSTFNATDSVPVSQPSSGYQSAWLGGHGQKSMAEIVKMGRPQNKVHTTLNQSQPNIDDSPDNEWPEIEPSQAVTVVDTHVEPGLNPGQVNPSYEINEFEPQDESSSEDDDVAPDSVSEPVYSNMDSYQTHDDASEHKEVEEFDPSVLSVSESMQKLNVQEEEHVVQPEEDDVPSVVIPSHLQVHTADLSHLSFGSFGANVNTGISQPSSIHQSETTNLEYYEEGPTRTSPGAENYELPSASQNTGLKQHDPEMTHGGQSQYGFSHNQQLLDSSFPQSQTPSLILQQAAAANGHPFRESDLSQYSQFSVSQSLPARYASSASSISDPAISMAEALKTVGLSPSQQPQQNHPTAAVPQHLTMHPYSQPTVPLAHYATNMMGYPPYLPQSYAYLASGFQPAFAGNSSYHQQLAAMYKNNVSVSSLPQSASVPSGYGSFGGSTAVPGNYQVGQPTGPAGSTLNYEDVLSAHYKENSHLLSLQQNENSPMWVHGGGSRTMSASAYYGLQQGQNQQQAGGGGFRQGQNQQQQQPSQSYGGSGLNYPDFFHSQTENSRDVGGSHGQPKLQSQQLWQNGY